MSLNSYDLVVFNDDVNKQTVDVANAVISADDANNNNTLCSDVNKANSVKAKVKVSHLKDKIKVVYLNTTA